MDSLWPSWEENKLFTVLVSLLVAAAVAALGFYAYNQYLQQDYIGQAPPQERSITISGKGEVVAIPDIAMVNLGYQSEQPTVAEAQQDNTDKINTLIERVKNMGISPQDIQTTSYNVWPRYDYIDGRQELRGYTVSQNVVVKVRDTSKISQVLALVGELGLNQVGGISFDIDEIETVQQEARLEALQNAKLKAEQLANVMGVKLKKVISFSESSNIPTYDNYARYAEGLGGGGAVPSIEQGSQEVTVTATITYEIE